MDRIRSIKVVVTLGVMLLVAALASTGSHSFAASSENASTATDETPFTPAPTDPIAPTPSKCEAACRQALEAALQAAEDARDLAYAAAEAAYDQRVQEANDQWEIDKEDCGEIIGNLCLLRALNKRNAAVDAAKAVRDRAFGQANWDFQQDLNNAVDAFDACMADCDGEPKKPVEQPIEVPLEN